MILGMCVPAFALLQVTLSLRALAAAVIVWAALLAPTQTELPFLVAQAVLLGVSAPRRFASRSS